MFFRHVCRHFLASGTGNAANPVSAVRATDVMVNQPSVDKGSDNTHVGDVVCFLSTHCLMELFMNADEVTRILAQSSQNDWIVDDDTGAFTYKNDLALHIKRADYDDYNSFNEPWAVRHPDSNACSVEYTVHYGSSFVDRKTLVSVDGHRATLPMPASATDLNVSSADVNFAKIVNIGDRVDEYIQRSGLTIKP